MELNKFKTKPFNHQLRCFNEFGRREYFALLAEQGTGKTWIIINNFADLWASNDCDGVLVFAPNGVHENWTRLEIPKHMPDWVRWRAAPWLADANKKEREAMDRLFSDAGNGELRILAMNWDSLATKNGVEMAQRFAGCFRRLMIVCDESSAVKNPKTDRTKALMKLKKFSHWRRIMDGTPIDGSPFSAFSQFMFLSEDILQTTSYTAFKAEYAEMMDERSHLIKHIVGKRVTMSDYDKQELAKDVAELHRRIVANGREELVLVSGQIMEAHDSQSYDKISEGLAAIRGALSPAPSKRKSELLRLMACIDSRVGEYLRKVANAFDPRRLPQIVQKDKNGRKKYKNLDKLNRLIAPHSFRVLKSECLDLPEKIYKTLFFRLTPEQQAVYDKAKDECRIEFQGVVTPFNKLVAITKLAQITSGYYMHPMTEEPVRIPGANPKMDMLVERCLAIKELGKQFIVWARYRVEIAEICERLRAAGLTVVEYHGGVDKDDRKAAIDAMSNGEADGFIGNQQAGGTGITVLTSFVIYYSNDWSLRNRLQSEDRAHRIGQTDDVVYINLVAKDTVDEKVVAALMDKQEVADVIVDRGHEWIT